MLSKQINSSKTSEIAVHETCVFVYFSFHLQWIAVDEPTTCSFPVPEGGSDRFLVPLFLTPHYKFNAPRFGGFFVREETSAMTPAFRLVFIGGATTIVSVVCLVCVVSFTARIEKKRRGEGREREKKGSFPSPLSRSSQPRVILLTTTETPTWSALGPHNSFTAKILLKSLGLIIFLLAFNFKKRNWRKSLKN